MELMKLIERRESCRKYMNTPVKRELIDRCIEAARLAPSACNAQPWRYIAVDNPQIAAKVAPLLRAEGSSVNSFTDGVPAFIVAVEKPVDLTAKLGPACVRANYSELDIGISVAHLCLTATEAGLGCCVLGVFKEEGIQALLGIPGDYRVRLVVCLGYPAPGDPRPKMRLERDKMSAYNRFSEAIK